MWRVSSQNQVGDSIAFVRAKQVKDTTYYSLCERVKKNDQWRIKTIESYGTEKPVRYLPIVLQGHILDVIRDMPDECVDLIPTSPPYWGQRFYGEAANTIWGGDPGCDHDWIEHRMGPIHENRNNLTGTQEQVHGKTGTAFIKKYDDRKGAFCSKCGAWLGQLGLEPHPQMYVDHIVVVCRELKRVLKKTGSVYLVMGDTYFGGGQGGNTWPGKSSIPTELYGHVQAKPDGKWLQSKQRMLIPHRVAIALQDDGWIVRNDNVWWKKNPMPESVEDRRAQVHEYIFHIVKHHKYWFDLDSIREPYKPLNRWGGYIYHPPKKTKMRTGEEYAVRHTRPQEVRPNLKGKNPGDVIVCATKSSKEVHYATFPEKLIKSLVISSCPRQICKQCGRPRRRLYEKKPVEGMVKGAAQKYQMDDTGMIDSPGGREHYISIQLKNPPDKVRLVKYLRKWKGKVTYKEMDKLMEKEGDCASHWFTYPENEHGFAYPSPEDWMELKRILGFDGSYDKQVTETVEVLVDDKGSKKAFVGWSDCGCNAGWIPGIIFDPFMGTSTSLLVAIKLKMRSIGVDLVPKYCDISIRRIQKEVKQLGKHIECIPTTIVGAEELYTKNLFPVADLVYTKGADNGAIGIQSER